ncbi:hypothetical protein Poli38472_007913 [Pythium oligandrum]|uniref:Transmembrane protein n=1 Tax=Pythium oligandrum TaxID=41045 RepID=A0A8K1CKG6_PYTOL|nr:hypothetical protein Poli38472_007913 [Pythium oligandrum]|eukprot:TMW65271.1 hypothetical protein Poli38472_007913 [Pythium oligandrum]
MADQAREEKVECTPFGEPDVELSRSQSPGEAVTVDVQPEEKESDRGFQKAGQAEKQYEREMIALAMALRANYALGSSSSSFEDDEVDESEWISLAASMFIYGAMMAVFLIIPIFWCLRVDHIVSWNWAVVFIPLWVIDILLYCVIGCAVLIGDSVLEDHPYPSAYKLFMFTKALLLLLTQVFVVQKLNGDIDWSVVYVLMPYFVFDGVTVAGELLKALVLYVPDASHEYTQPGYVGLKMTLMTLTTALSPVVIRLVQILLIALRIDGTLGNTSWWVVFAPVWISFEFTLLVFLTNVVRLQVLIAFFSHLKLFSPHFLVLAFIGLCLVMAPFFVLAARLQSGSFSSFYILVPYFVLAGGLLLGAVGIGIKLMREEAASTSRLPCEAPLVDSSSKVTYSAA